MGWPGSGDDEGGDQLTTSQDSTSRTDPDLWLEDVHGEDAMAWVRAGNAETVRALSESDGFGALRESLREVLDADDRVPFVRRRGEWLYNFWQDATNPRGLWRRATLAAYRSEQPEWEILLDVDALAEKDGESWVYKGASVLRPGHHRALVTLSRGGADATVVREFDITRREFVAAAQGGFELAEAKSIVSWIDQDHIYVGTDRGPGSLTTSGYPRTAQLWRRGTALAGAETVAEADPEDIAVEMTHDPTPGFERSLMERSLDFFHSEWSIVSHGAGARPIPVPSDCRVVLHREWLLVRTRSAWTVDGTEYPSGSLLAAHLEPFLSGECPMTPVFVPDAHTTLDDYSWTRHHLLLATLSDVRSRLELLTPPDPARPAAKWDRRPLDDIGLGELDSVHIAATDPEGSDEYFLNATGFTRPSTLLRGDASDPGSHEVLKQSPEYFDAAAVTTTQHFAKSDDGTRIPYFVVRPGNGTDAAGPVLLTGYGGFEISRTPAYSPIVGRGWLACGGTYVLANIRGGGEYGPDWHTAAMRENRSLAYADFAAVASDLVERGIAANQRTIGALGGSNGGLLMGVMLTRYPERFGAVVSRQPLLDMARYHLLHAGASWIAEYGDPDVPSDWEFIRQYSPYHNVDPSRTYPPSLFATSTRDDRVHPGHARKMVARLRSAGHTVHYYENIEGGHAGSADNAQTAFVWALVMTFLRQSLEE